MTISIGRFSIADGVARWDHSAGGRVSASGDFNPASVATGKAYRDQLLGLIDSPEVVRVSDTDDSTRDGFYRVNGGSVTPNAASDLAGMWSWSLDLERVPHSSSMLMEAVTIGGDRANKHASVTAKPWHAVQADAVAYDRDGTTTTYYTRTGPGGSVKYLEAYGPGYTDAKPTWRVAPGDFYDMAATFKADGSNAVQGTQIPATTSGWTLDNGLIKMTGGTSGTATLEWPDSGGTAYGRDITLTFGYQNATFGWTAFSTNKAVQVLRNDPYLVTIRLVFELVPAFTTQTYVIFTDISLRRGSLMFEICQTSRGDLLNGVSLGEAMTVTGSAANEIMRTSSNDADGNRTVIISDATSTQQNGAAVTTPAGDVTPAGTWYRLLAGDEKVFPYAVGCEYAGSSAVAPNRYTDLRDQYMAFMGIVERPAHARALA